MQKCNNFQTFLDEHSDKLIIDCSVESKGVVLVSHHRVSQPPGFLEVHSISTNLLVVYQCRFVLVQCTVIIFDRSKKQHIAGETLLETELFSNTMKIMFLISVSKYLIAFVT